MLPQELTIYLSASQQIEMPTKFAGVISMANTVKRARSATCGERSSQSSVELHAPNGGRKYLNPTERRRFLAATETLPAPHALFARLLAWTGARVSEALFLTPHSFQLDECKITFVTLKRRKFATREVPIPEAFMKSLDELFSLRDAQRDPVLAGERLWKFSRVSAWSLIKTVMARAEIRGLQACPKGLRHGAAIAMLQSGVPINLIKRLLGHARLSTTEIYLDVIGPEERALVSKFWWSSLPFDRARTAFANGLVRLVKQLWSHFVFALRDRGLRRAIAACQERSHGSDERDGRRYVRLTRLRGS